MEVSGREIEDITGRRRGRTTSLSISRKEAADGGGIGNTLRMVPMGLVSKRLTVIECKIYQLPIQPM